MNPNRDRDFSWYSRTMLRRFRAVILVLISGASIAASPETVNWTGWISDSKCGAKMTGYCAKACISAGEKPVFVGEDKRVLPISNPEVTKGFEGEHVAVKGNASEGKLTISSIERTPLR